MSPAAKRRLFRALGGSALALVFVGVLGAALALHLVLPPGRRAAARSLVALLDRTFQGRFELAEVSELSLDSVLADGFRVREPGGKLVLEGRGVRIRANVVAILRELLDDDPKKTIVVEYARVERATVVLAPLAATGELGLVRAFTPRPTPSTTTSAPVPRVWLSAVEIGRGSVHAELVGLPPLDGEITGARGQVLVAPAGVAVDAARFSAVVKGLLAEELRAVGSFHQRGTSHFWSSLDGYAGDLQFDSIVRLDGKHLAVTLDVPRGEPKTVRELLPSWPLEQTATAHLEAAGDLPKLDAKATATVGTAELGASGSIEFSPRLHLRLATEGKDIDVRALFPDAPETRIGARVTLDVTATEHGVELTSAGATDPSSIGGVPLPATTFQASYGPKGLTGTAELAEEGLPLDATFALEPGGVLVLDARSRRFAIERAPRLARFTAARGNAEFHVKGRLEKQKLDATLTADVDGFELEDLTLGSAHVTGRATGLVTAPRELELRGALDAKRLRWGGLAFDDVDATVSGPLARLSVSSKLVGPHGASVEAKARLDTLGGTHLDDVDLTVTREGRTLHGRAGHVAVEGESLEVADVKLEGAGGTLTGSGRYRPGLLEVDARGQDLDLGTMAQVLGFTRGRPSGKVNVNAEVAVARDVRRGSVSIGVRDGALGPVSGVNLELTTTLDGENVSGTSSLEMAGFGKLESAFELAVKGSLFAPDAWRRATGRLDVGVERLELARVAPFLPAPANVQSLAGVVAAQVSLVRDDAEKPPSVALLAATSGLVVVEKAAAGAEPLTIAGIEGQVSAHVDGKQDFAQADVRLVDEHGLLLSGSGRIDIDVKRALAAPRESWSWLRREPVVATVVLDDRPLGELPVWVRPTRVQGTLRLETSMRGSIAAPMLAARASVAGLTFGEVADVHPFDVCGTLQYDPLAQRLGLGAQAHLPGKSGTPCGGARVAVARATGTIDPERLLRGERGYEGDAELGFEDLPLEFVPPLAESGMAGRVRGAVAVDARGDTPSLNASLRLADIAVHAVPVGTGELTLRSDGHTVTAEAKLARGDGALEATAGAGMVWERALPRVDAAAPMRLDATIHDIDAALLSPVVGSVLADLSGRLDGDVHVALAAPGTGPADSRLSELTGALTLKGGALQLSGLGMRLSNVKFAATAERRGQRTVIAVRGLSAASGAKYDNVAASADVYLEGLKLVDARANVNLSRVPLLIEGVSQATLSGAAALELFPTRDPMLVAIQLHDLTAELPRSSGRSVLAVDDNPDIIVRQPLREPTRADRAGALRWQLAFDLGQKVKLTRADLQIPLKGRPVVDLGDTADVSGDLELLSGGRVELLGKGFVIESGEVHFDTPDPGDPHIRVLSSWRAPEGTTVYVEVGGTLRQATLRLSSDPALTPPEIQALLLGGASDGGDAQAAGVGYGADFVGQLLADTPLRRVELRTANETSADARNYLTYTAAVPVSENVWVELSYKNLESNSPAEHTDAASATVDWRFKRDWSLRTEAGTIGTGLDLLWQYRY